MSATSTRDYDIKSIKEKLEKEILVESNKLYMFSNYRVGGEPKKDKLEHIIILNQILCSPNCEISDYINKKIEGKLDPQHKEKKLCNKIKEYKECYEKHSCSDSDVINECCPLSSLGQVQW